LSKKKSQNLVKFRSMMVLNINVMSMKIVEIYKISTIFLCLSRLQVILRKDIIKLRKNTKIFKAKFCEKENVYCG
jgi:hypothetical protein